MNGQKKLLTGTGTVALSRQSAPPNTTKGKLSHDKEKRMADNLLEITYVIFLWSRSGTNSVAIAGAEHPKLPAHNYVSNSEHFDVDTDALNSYFAMRDSKNLPLKRLDDIILDEQ